MPTPPIYCGALREALLDDATIDEIAPRARSTPVEGPSFELMICGPWFTGTNAGSRGRDRPRAAPSALPCREGALRPASETEPIALAIDEADLLAEFLDGAVRDDGPRTADEVAPQGAPALLEALLDPSAAIAAVAAAPAPAASEVAPTEAIAASSRRLDVQAATSNPTGGDERAGTAASSMHRFVGAVIGVAQSYLDARTARMAGELLLEGKPPVAAEPTEEAALARARMVESSPDGLRPCASFLAARDAWSALLRGDCADFSGCGEKTLDQWAAELIAALAGRSDVSAIQRALRKRKVAAFGMLED